MKPYNSKQLFFFLYILINLFVKSSTECIISGYDLDSISKAGPWKTIYENSTHWVEYYINICGTASACGNNHDSAVCQTSHSLNNKDEITVTKIGDFRAKSDYVTKVIDDKKELWVTLNGSDCDAGGQYKTFIYFKCGESLGSPVFLDTYNCDTYFEWYTDALCKSPKTATQVKCYLFDNNTHVKRSLIPLVGQNVTVDIGTNSKESIMFDVCKGLNEGEGYPKDTAVLNMTSKKPLGMITANTELIIDVDNNLQLKYDGVPNSNCSTTITFICPERGGSKQPIVISTMGCQYAIEWETVYACPEESFTSKTCTLSKDIHGVVVDLSPLTKSPGQFYNVSGNNSIGDVTYMYYMNICGKVKDVACPGTNSETMAVCQQNIAELDQSKKIGDTTKQTLRYIDGQLSLLYQGGVACGHNNKQRESLINFHCDKDTDGGRLEYVDENDCTYIFDMFTKLACIKRPGMCSIVGHSGGQDKNYDLSLLSRTTVAEGNWEALKSNPETDKNTYWLNLCGLLVQSPDVINCPLGSAVCMIDSDNKAVNLGGEGSLDLKKDVNGESLTITFEDGGICQSGKYKTVLNLHCKKGALEDPPILSNSNDCTFEFDWYTAAACPEDRVVGGDCRVFVDNLGYEFDLNPLKSTGESDGIYKVPDDSGDQNYYINVCAAVLGEHCQTSHIAGVCQEGQHGEEHGVVTGIYSDVLIYDRGILKLNYIGGDPYNTKPTPILRKTEILFICDFAKGVGHPEYTQETDHKYSFKWYTKYACPALPVECTVQNSATGEEYDLSKLADSSKSWLAVKTDETDPTTKYEYFIGVCGPLGVGNDSPAVSCGANTAVCEVTYTASKEAVEKPNLGHATSGPTIVAKNHLLLTYTGGEKCVGNENVNYTTEVHLYCEAGALDTSPEFLGIDDNCLYKFKWMTESACNIKEHEVSGGSSFNCSIYDQNIDYTFNLKPLLKTDAPYYQVTSHDKLKSFKINICGVLSTCGGHAKGETSPSVCMNDETVLGNNSTQKLSYSEDGRLILTYEGEQFQTSRYSVEIRFACNDLVPLGAPSFYDSVADTKYIFEVQTALACPPKPVDCFVVDNKGNEFDLKTLARDDDNWVTSDSGGNKYYINVCKSVVKTSDVSCTGGGGIGGCQVASNGKSFNMGYVQSKPTVAEDGTITIQYYNGDRCHAGTSTEGYRSTIIFFTCGAEQEPAFREETAQCQYIIDWQTRSACPVKVTTGNDCKIKDPLYGQTFDFTQLQKPTEDYKVSATGSKGEAYNFIINVCSPLHTTSFTGDCVSASGKQVGSCQTGTNLEKNAGLVGSELRYSDGEISLEYKNGSSCHNGMYQRSTVLTFKCDHSTHGSSDGPKYIEETDDCIYNFEWATHLACFDFSKLPDCRYTDTDGKKYNLADLTLASSSYKIPGPDANTDFYINICGPVVNGKGITCPPDSGSCLAVKNAVDGSVKFSSIGKLSGHSLEKEGDGLIVRYDNGDACITSGKTMSTVIIMKCDENAVDTSATYIFVEDCVYHFTWMTKIACPIDTDSGVDKPGRDCSITNPQTGKVFNLQQLASSDGNGFTIQDTNDGLHEYVLDICQAPKNTPCQPHTGACQFDKNDRTKSWNAGKFNTSPYINGNNGNIVYLKYTNGDKCHGDMYNRTTIISFVCSHTVDAQSSSPVFISELEDCTYHFNWHTKLVCEDEVLQCSVNGDLDLSSLVKNTGHYIAINSMESVLEETSAIYINPCHALNPIPGTLCPAGSGVCLDEKGSSPKGLGYPAGPPRVVDGKVELRYVNGSECTNSNNEKVKYKSKIIFSCKRGLDMGIPNLISFNRQTCEYVFTWATNAVCSATQETAKNCEYFDNRTGILIDFKKLSLLPGMQPYEVISSRRGTYSINICGQAPGCDGDSVACLKKTDSTKQSYGEMTSDVNFIPQGDMIKMHYKSNKICKDNEYFNSYIYFICDRDVVENGKPTLLTDEADCSVVFNWRTHLTCPPVIQECIVAYQDKTFNLQLLSRPDTSWITASADGDVYHINLCRSVNDLPGCPKSAAVCRTTNSFKDVQVLGKVETQIMTYKDDEIIVQYSGGSTSACKNGQPSMVEMYLKCGTTLGKPSFLMIHEDSDKCIYEFEWKTREACKEERHEVKLLSGEFLTEPLSGRLISLKDINDKISFHETLDDNVGTNDIRYKISLFDELSECGPNSVVCLVKFGETSGTSIGDRTDASYFFQGNVLEAEYRTNTICKNNDQKKVRSLIEFQCSETTFDLMLHPMYEYKTEDCEYVFYWYTPELCFFSPVEANIDVKHRHTVAVVLSIIICIIVICVIAAIFHNPTRRKYCYSGIRRLFTRSGSSEGSFRYSRIAQNDRESRAGLLINQEETDYGSGQGDLPAFQDDSDDDMIL